MNKKMKNNLLIVTIILVLVVLIGHFGLNAFSIFGDESRVSSSAAYAGNLLPNTWVMPVGRAYDGTISDYYSHSYLSSDSLTLDVRYASSHYWAGGPSVDYGTAFSTASGSGGSFEGDVGTWTYKVYVDGNYVDSFGSISGGKNGSQSSNQRFYMDMFTGQGSDTTSFCVGVQCSRLVQFGYGVDSRFFSQAGFSKPLSSINYDASKTIHSVGVKAYPVALQYGVGVSWGTTYWLDESNISAVNAEKDVVLNALGITPNASYYPFISHYNRLGCTGGSNCYYGPGGAGMQRIYSFNISGFPTLQQKYVMNVYSGSIYVEPKECLDQNHYVTKMFTATGGDTVSIHPQVGQISVPSSAIFCHTLPVLEQTLGTTFLQDYQPYDTLKYGVDVNIPSGQNWIFFYKDVPTNGNYYFCADNNGIYDSVSNKCVIAPAIEYTCVSGVFNSNTKTCLTQASVQKICSVGVYNSITDRCEYSPPQSIICSVGSYNTTSGKCDFYPDLNNVCSTGTFNAVNNKCEFVPPLVNVCVKGSFVASSGFCVYSAPTQLTCSAGVLQGNMCVIDATPKFITDNVVYLLGGLIVLVAVLVVIVFRKRGRG